MEINDKGYSMHKSQLSPYTQSDQGTFLLSRLGFLALLGWRPLLGVYKSMCNQHHIVLR